MNSEPATKITNNWVSKDPFYHWKAQWKKVERDVLTDAELRTMMEKEFSINRLEQVRDIFVFCCFTGLAYVDVQKLSDNHIVLGMDGDRWIKINRSKTDSRSSIPLLPAAEVQSLGGCPGIATYPRGLGR